MRIRWKLFLLLLVLSLGPILLLRMNAQQSMREVGEDLALQTRTALVDNVAESLLRLVEDHARLLRRERQLLEAALELQAARIQFFESGQGLQLVPTDQGDSERRPTHEVSHYCAPAENGECVAFGVDDNALVEFPGGWGRWWAGSPKKLDHSLVPVFRETFVEYGEMLMWTLHAQQERGLLLYPAPPPDVFETGDSEGDLSGGMGMMRRGMGRHMQGMHRMWSGIERLLPPPGEGEDATIWHGPMADPMTGRAVFVIVRPLLSAGGEPEGRAAFVVPVSALFHAGVHLPDVSEHMQAYMVSVDGDRLRIEASTAHDAATQSHTGNGHGAWQLAGEQAMYLGSEDSAGTASIARDLAAGSSGISVHPLERRQSIWAYAPVGLSGLHLVLVAPEKDVIAEAEALGEYVGFRIDKQMRATGVILLIALGVIFAISFLLSSSMTRRLKILADQARRLSKGDFEARSGVGGSDEIGELGRVLDDTGPALSERMRIKEALDVAMQVQQSLLPDEPPAFAGFDIAARSDYCDETGGDFYDFVERKGFGPDRLLALVGDVSGHGIPAALLMSSTRAYLRSRAAQPGPVHELVEHVNAQLSRDSHGTGQFVTMLLLELNAESREVHWVRAGHDPALLFDSETGEMTELVGPGVSLGVAEDLEYESRHVVLTVGQVLIVGTDGIWEMRSASGEMYGKSRFREAITRHVHKDAQNMVDAIFEELYAFLGDEPREDDITLLVIKNEFRSETREDTNVRKPATANGDA
ncbi:hypothetical protein DPQ33_09785 [Oceanidesulfovibrio indonesiensis]|uniref:HAMP domain-containing protein n=1 Tax=Oceanidesulfovibrio indonesiensis TaxID=54767 RepID=A0A7M3MF69_9BACT|nr:SpoIIE family protein phosphatase [Oceanidesulfovibrio indonesiensis]TVM17083.1 hypothetical protein DPQ33_09785 [Oceanidesulfovibrio indonesiensis]